MTILISESSFSMINFEIMTGTDISPFTHVFLYPEKVWHRVISLINV